MNALEPYFNYRALWIEHEEALARLYALQDRLDFYLSGAEPEDLDVQKLTEYHEQYQMIWDELSKKWIQQRKRAPG